VDFVEICKVCTRKMIIKAAKRIFNSDNMCRSYSDLNFGVTFLEHSVVFSGISLMAILQGIASSERVKVRQSPLASKN